MVAVTAVEVVRLGVDILGLAVAAGLVDMLELVAKVVVQTPEPQVQAVLAVAVEIAQAVLVAVVLAS
jgi:hypothetical protein